MPIPTPHAGESQKDFVSRCMSAIGGEYEDKDQAVAVCFSSWRDREKRNARMVNLIGNSAGTVRVAKYEGREHVVVPIVALIGDEVVWPANADTPEFIPAAELSRAAASWAGRPAVGDHPQIDGHFVSANRPDVMERFAFGRVGDSRFENGQLVMDVWLDRVKAELVGEAAVDVIRRAEAKEPIEVSVGALVELEALEGVSPKGKPYRGVWRNIGSDHIAFLPRGTRGACSNEMGCGLRAAKLHVLTAEGLTLVEETEQPAQGHAPNLPSDQGQPLRVAFNPNEPRDKDGKWTSGGGPGNGGARKDMAHGTYMISQSYKDPKRGYDASYYEKIGPRPVDVRPHDLGHHDTMDQAKAAAHAHEKGLKPAVSADALMEKFLGPARGDADYNMKRFVDSVIEDGKAQEAMGWTPARWTAEWRSWSALRDDNNEGTNAWDSTSRKGMLSDGSSAATSAKETEMKTLIERVAALIENPKTPFTKCDEKMLLAGSEDRLAVLEAHYEENPTPTPVPDPEPTPEPEPEPTPQLPEGVVAIPQEELVALRAMAAREQARDAACKTELVRDLSANQKVYTEAELKALSISDLEKLVKLVSRPREANLVGKLLPSVTAEDAVPPPPDAIAVARQLSGMPAQ